VSFRTAPVWLALFGAVQPEDAWTPAVDRARGAVEAMPVTAGLLTERGPEFYLGVKLALVVAAAAAVLLCALWARQERPGSRPVYRFVIGVVQVATVLVALTSLENALLLRSL